MSDDMSSASQDAAKPFNRVAILGLGLIGASIARGLRQKGLARVIAGYDADDAARGEAERLGLVDKMASSAAAAVAGAELVILSVPVRAMGSLAGEISGALAAGQIVTDVGSVKGSVLAQVAPHMPDGVHFIPGHPVAGTEQSGPGAGFAELFEDRWVILTPPQGADEDAVLRLTAFWQGLGSQVTSMDAEHHDMVLSITSHIPHLIAYNLVATAHDLEQVTEREVIKFSAGGFRDFTRIASSDPTMWRDVFLANRDAVLDTLGAFIEEMTILRRAIRQGDGELLFDLFSRAREIRKGIIEAGQESAEPDFGRHPELHDSDKNKEETK
jgi:cyclohexadieny/prephenate dehydrogenase